MLRKIQHHDTSCFQIVGSTSMKALPSVGVSVSPVEKVERRSVKQHSDRQEFLEAPNGLNKRLGRVYTKSSSIRKNAVSHKLTLTRHGSIKNPDGEAHAYNCGEVRMEKKSDFGVELETGSTKRGVVEKVHTRCSTEWLRYGGCIPAILEALKKTSDLDKALKPWENTLNNKERSIILKEQCCWKRALEIFEWFKSKGCYEVNVIHYNIMLRLLGKAQRWNEVQRLWDEMRKRRVQPINSTYGTLIDACSKGGLKEEALRWLELMYEQRMEPDEVTMGIVVQLYKKAGEFVKAKQFFEKWSSGVYKKCEGRTNSRVMASVVDGNSSPHVCLSSHTYNTLIDTYGKAGQLKEASETFAQMLREGVVATTVTFNTMIHICGNNGRLEEVASLMQKMEHLGYRPDTRTYNILISLYAKHDDIKLAANYFTKMKEASLEPDTVSYRTLLYAFSIRHMVSEAEALISEMDKRSLEIDEFTQSALTRMYIESGMLQKSWLWFERFHLKGHMSSECYSANIDAFGERGHVVEAEKVFRCGQERKNRTVLEFNVMVKAYGISKRYHEACCLFDNMEKHGVSPDKCSYNSLIQVLSGANLPEKAIVYVRKMHEAGLVSDCIPYCAVISSFAKLGQLEKAVGVYKEMTGFNVQPDVVAYGVLINAFANIGNVKEATYYVDAMRAAGLHMNAVIHNSLIKLYTKVGYLKEAQDTYKMLQSFEEGPDAYSSNCMIDLYSERSMIREAEEIFENMKRKGNANEFSYAMMLCMYRRLGRFQEAIQSAHKMRELGLLSDLLSYNQVLGLYSSEGRFKEAAAIFMEMIESAVQPDDSTFKSLGVVLVKCGVPKQAVGKLEVMWKRNGRSGLQAWISTLSSVVYIDGDDDGFDEQ